MMRRFAILLLAGLVTAGAAHAQPLGTFRWQLQPYCNVFTLAVTQNGGVYRLEGTDDQCGAGGPAASVIGTAFLNPDGTVGMGLNVVASPGGAPMPVSAQITIASLGGTWRDAAGRTGPFIFTPGAGTGGTPRPLPATVIPTTIQLRSDGAVLAASRIPFGAIPASGAGDRMMWHPFKAAFRAGGVSATQWDEANVGLYSVALGRNTVARDVASVAIGQEAQALGSYSMALGWDALADGDGSTAIGPQAQALGNYSFAGTGGIVRGHNGVAFGLGEVRQGAAGSFVWGDYSGLTRAVADQPNQFVVRAAGGVRFATNSAQTSGVVMFSGANAWSALSDRNMKTHIRALDGEDVLGKLAAMPVTEWSYTTQDASIRHVGPMAQDFHAAFGLGEDALRISTIDADGIALAGVKALEARTRALSEAGESLRSQNVALADHLADMERENTALRERLARLERLIEPR